MTEQTMPADKAREIIGGMRESMRRAEYDGSSHKFMSSMLVYVAALEALLPPPPRPTLADMTREERRACQWMQADTNGGRFMISNPCYDQGRATILRRDGTSIPLGMEKITPRPDLPRMEWPRDTGIPGVAVGVPVADPDLIRRISDEAPPGTIVVEANLSATVRNGRYWHSAEEGHLTLAEALFYAPHEWDATVPITVVRWGE